MQMPRYALLHSYNSFGANLFKSIGIVRDDIEKSIDWKFIKKRDSESFCNIQHE